MDYYSEFFIYRIQRAKLQIPAPQKREFKAVNPTQIRDVLKREEKSGFLEQFLDVKEKDWDSTFSIDLSLLPLKFGVSKKLADKILFIGKVAFFYITHFQAIRILQNSKNAEESSFVFSESILGLVQELRSYDALKF